MPHTLECMKIAPVETAAELAAHFVDLDREHHANHVFQVLHDAGPYRHMKLTPTESSMSSHSWEVVTFPGHVTIAANLYSKRDEAYTFRHDDVDDPFGNLIADPAAQQPFFDIDEWAGKLLTVSERFWPTAPWQYMRHKFEHSVEMYLYEYRNDDGARISETDRASLTREARKVSANERAARKWFFELPGLHDWDADTDEQSWERWHELDIHFHRTCTALMHAAELYRNYIAAAQVGA